MKNILLFVVIIFFSSIVNGQNVGIGTTTPNSSAALEISSTSGGLLIPTMTQAQRDAIHHPAKGLLIFQNDGNTGFYFNNGTPESPGWVLLGGSSNGWSLSGNNGINPATQFIGTTDDQPLIFKINNTPAGHISRVNEANISLGLNSLTKATEDGIANVAMGTNALGENTDGSVNTAIGFYTLYKNKDGSRNIAIGGHALRENISGGYNVAVGTSVLSANQGNFNTAVGTSSLYRNTTGSYNSVVGYNALSNSQTASGNSALGAYTLYFNNGGYSNVAIGHYASFRNREGSNIVAIGDSALYSSMSGGLNTAVGSKALYSSNGGIMNAALGNVALFRNTTGHSNTAVGYYSLFNVVTGSRNTAIGVAAGPYSGAGATENFTAIGYGAGQVGSNSNTIEIGNTSVMWIGGQVGWSTYSDEKIKDDIKADVPGLAFISKLRPVTYRLNITRQHAISGIADTAQWGSKYDIQKITQSGFIAQEVEQAARECNYDFNGVTAPKGNSKLYSLQYSSFVVPLVKAIQEQQQIIETLRTENASLDKRLRRLEGLLLQ